MPQTTVVSPRSTDEFDRYYELRWSVLRAPLNMPRGSERDDLETASLHAVIWGADGRAIAAGRLHFNSAAEAQIRYMAVAEAAQCQGLGRQIVEHLVDQAHKRGATSVILNSRAEAVPFYERLGFATVGAAEQFAGIPHWRMKKHITASG